MGQCELDFAAPLLYVTNAPHMVQRIPQRYLGEDIGAMIEACFVHITTLLCEQGFSKFILAGSETSSLIAQKLDSFTLGNTIVPSVP